MTTRELMQQVGEALLADAQEKSPHLTGQADGYPMPPVLLMLKAVERALSSVVYTFEDLDGWDKSAADCVEPILGNIVDARALLHPLMCRRCLARNQWKYRWELVKFWLPDADCDWPDGLDELSPEGRIQ